MVLHIAGDENTGNRGQAAVLGEQVAVWKSISSFPLKTMVFGSWPMATKYAVERNVARFLGLPDCADSRLPRDLRSMNILHGERRDEFDFRVGPARSIMILESAKIISAVNQMDLAGVARQKVGSLPSRNRRRRSPRWVCRGKNNVASRAGGNAAADQFFFTLQPHKRADAPAATIRAFVS